MHPNRCQRLFLNHIHKVAHVVEDRIACGLDSGSSPAPTGFLVWHLSITLFHRFVSEIPELVFQLLRIFPRFHSADQFLHLWRPLASPDNSATLRIIRAT